MEKNPHNRVANNSRHIKRIIHHDQMEFIPGIQGFSNICRSNNAIHHVNKLKNKSHMIISIDVEEAFWQNRTPIYGKNWPESGHRGNTSQYNKAIYSKPTANIILNGEKLKAFLWISGIRQGCPFWPLLFNVVLVVLVQQWGKKKINKLKKKQNCHCLQMTCYYT